MSYLGLSVISLSEAAGASEEMGYSLHVVREPTLPFRHEYVAEIWCKEI